MGEVVKLERVAMKVGACDLNITMESEDGSASVKMRCTTDGVRDDGGAVDFNGRAELFGNWGETPGAGAMHKLFADALQSVCRAMYRSKTDVSDTDGPESA